MASETPARGAESPTTARPLDFDDEQETGVTDSSTSANAATSASTAPVEATPTKPPRSSSLRPVKMADEDPPAKPPRPVSPGAQNEQILVEAFPGIERQVIKAVLAASGGQIDPAFNALLGMSDPEHVEQEQPPPQPPRPTQEQRQLEQDEMYARQLAEHYASRDQRRAQQAGDGPYPGPPRQQQRQGPGAGQDDKDYNFFDDDLPRIRENMRQGFLQTQTKFNSWITDMRKRFDGEEEVDNAPGPASQHGPSQYQPRQNFGSSQREQMIGIQKTAERQRAAQQQHQGPYAARRSTDQERYDADPHEIGNFEELELRDDELDEDERPPKKPARPAANPALFASSAASVTAVPPPQSGPVDEVDALYRNDTPPGRKGSAAAAATASAKSKKWQPLTSLAPAPESEMDEHDPFSVGDEDEDEEKQQQELERKKSVDIKKEDTDRLKARAASIDAGEATTQKKLEPAERTGSVGTRDKAAEELMKEAAEGDEKKETAAADEKADSRAEGTVASEKK